MKKQHFPESFLKKNASSDQAFKLGKKLAQDSQYFKGPIADEEDCQITYQIKDLDHKNEQVQLQFFPNGLIKSFSCSCSYSNHREGLCSHVVGALFDLNQYEAEHLPSSFDQDAARPSQSHNRNDQAVRTMLKNYWKETQRTNTSFSKETIQFEFNLSIRGSEKISFYVLSMRVGLDYLYVVQDIEALVNDIQDQQKIEFGKRFSYDPEKHRIKLEDQKMLDLIAYILQLMQSTSPGRHGSKGNEIYIPPEMLKEVMLQLKKVDAGFIHNEFEWADEESPQQKTIIYQEMDQLPLSFQLKHSQDDFYAFISVRQSIKALRLFARSNVIYFDGDFYFLQAAEYQALDYLKSAFQSVDYEALIMTSDQFSLFASNVLPQIRSLVHIQMDPALDDLLQTPQLHAVLYIDYQDDRLYVRPVFRYASQSIYPFETEVNQEGSDQHIVVRDLVAENNKLELLVEAMDHFTMEESYASTHHMSQISHFFYHDLEILSQEYDIMMTRMAQNMIYSPSRSPHIQVEMNESTRLLDINFEMEDIPEEEIPKIIRLLEQDRQYYRLSNGKILNLQDQAFQQMNEAIQSLDLQENEIQSHMQAPLFKGLTLVDNDQVARGEQLKEMTDHLFHAEELLFNKPELLEADLRSFQITGFNWLKTLDHYGFGGVLADDMGLGKTVQTIAFICSKIEQGQGPYIVICPASVLYNWEHEFKKFAPQIKTQIVAGSKAERQSLIEEEAAVYITSYPLILRDADLYQGMNFSTMVLDEAQHVKNVNAKTTRAVQSMNRQQVIALSGTPIENNLGELYSLFSIVLPGLFTSVRHFKSLDHRQIAVKIKPFVLRRLKSEVLFELPEKTESVELIDISVEQKKLYQGQVQILKKDIQAYVDQDQWHKGRMSVLASMTRLRQICNDPRLFMGDYEGESTKLQRLLEILLAARENGKRVVLFSQFTKMLAYIRQEVEKMGMAYHYLDGSTPAKDRLDMAHRFNMGEKNLFLISLKAGGTGLNLTGGDTVILYDSWWNPAIEDQAADRVHRFGQKNVVQVIRMIAKGTIEEHIYELQNEKRQLLEDMIDSGGTSLSDLSAEELLALIEM